MYTAKIINPETGRSNQVKVFEVSGAKAVELLRQERGAKLLSLELLNQPESLSEMAESAGGDSAANNFALNVFETGLDWGLGLKALAYLRALSAIGKRPKVIRLAANRKGDVWVLAKDLSILM